MRRHGRELLLVVGGACLYLIGFYVLFVYLATFMDTETHLPLAVALRISTLGLMGIAGLTAVFGYLSDRVGRRTVQLSGAGSMVALTYPLFVLFEKGDPALDLLGQLIFSVTFAAQGAVTPGLLAEMLPMRVRGSGFATSFNVAAAVAGASPMLATYLIAVSGLKVAPSMLLIGAGVVAGVCYWLGETTGGET